MTTEEAFFPEFLVKVIQLVNSLKPSLCRFHFEIVWNQRLNNTKLNSVELIFLIKCVTPPQPEKRTVIILNWIREDSVYFNSAFCFFQGIFIHFVEIKIKRKSRQNTILANFSLNFNNECYYRTCLDNSCPIDI